MGSKDNLSFSFIIVNANKTCINYYLNYVFYKTKKIKRYSQY